MIAINAGRVLTPLNAISPGRILIEGEKIVAVGQPPEVPIAADATVIDAADRVVIPGFIDTHTHGRYSALLGLTTNSVPRQGRLSFSAGRGCDATVGVGVEGVEDSAPVRLRVALGGKGFPLRHHQWLRWNDCK